MCGNMGVIIIPFVLTAALCWYMRKHVTWNDNNVPRGIILLLLVLALVPILNIFAIIVFFILIVFSEGKIGFKKTKLNNFFKG